MENASRPSEGNVDIGHRDPDHPFRPPLPWRTKGIENYTICCPRCGSYHLSLIRMRARDTIANTAFTCTDCGSKGGLAIIATRHGLMLATD